MKEQIYAIPVNDAFKADTECPFCSMRNKLEKDTIDFMMGPSYMEDDIRMETNKIGFCKDHFKQMSLQQNKLGLALMVHTHLQQINKDLINLLPQDAMPTITKKSIFSKPILSSNNVVQHVHNLKESCYICNKIESMYVHFKDTFFYLWKKDDKFIDLVKNSKGFCLNHFADIYEEAPNKLSVNECTELYKIIIPIQIENLKRLEDELSWFISKFDYRYANEPWKNSKDSLPRTIQKISSVTVEETNNNQ